MSVLALGRRVAVILLTASTAVLAVGAAPAQAAIPSGAGWSASWRYYAANAIEFGATLPGVKAFGYATDTGGQRGAFVTIVDTVNDSRCARAVLSSPGVGTIGSATVCNGESADVGDPGVIFEGSLVLSVYRMFVFGGGADKASTLVIPPSKDDPTLRTVNTGASWKYTSATTYSYEVRRPDVFVTGNGLQEGDSRSAWSAVQSTATGPAAHCATGKVSGPGAAEKKGLTCTNGGVAAFQRDGFTEYITVEACSVAIYNYKRCLTVNVNKPH